MCSKSSKKISNKSISRIAAIQTLYQYDHKAEDHNIDQLLQKIISFYQNEDLNSDLGISEDNKIKIKPSVSYLILLVRTTIEHLENINIQVADHLNEEWQITKLPPLLLALLRVSICELKFFPETPRKVVINEFTDIASDMLSDNEVGFVNSVLDKIAKEA